MKVKANISRLRLDYSVLKIKCIKTGIMQVKSPSKTILYGPQAH